MFYILVYVIILVFHSEISFLHLENVGLSNWCTDIWTDFLSVCGFDLMHFRFSSLGHGNKSEVSVTGDWCIIHCL